MYTAKRLCCALIGFVLILAAPAAASADPFSVKTALGVTEHKNCSVSMQAGSVLEFSAVDLERRMNLPAGGLGGITVTSLPDAKQGGLFLDGVEVAAYEYLGRDDIDRMCFAASEVATAATITFIPKGAEQSTSLTIRIVERQNRAPVLEGSSIETVQNVPVGAAFAVSDPEGDEVAIQIIQAPQKGELVLSGLHFRYEPFLDKSGLDSFTVCAVDKYGAYSAQAVISIDIEKNRGGFHYADMDGNPSQYAAIKLHEAGVYTGAQFGGAWFFDPDEQTTRGEFLVLLLAGAGLDRDLAATVNTGLPNDSELPVWIKPYVRRAVEHGILSPSLPFSYGDTPSRAEAVVLSARAAAIDDVKSYDLHIGDLDKIPQWALGAYQDLAAYKMLDLHDGYAYPQLALTNAYAADLAWQLYKHTHR